MGLFNFPGVGEVSDTAPPLLFFKGTVPLFVLLLLPLQPFPTHAAFLRSQGLSVILFHPGFGQEKDCPVVSCDH